MQIPEESDTAEPKAPDSKAHDPKASEPKVKGSNRHRRLMSAEADASRPLRSGGRAPVALGHVGLVAHRLEMDGAGCFSR